MGWKGTVRSIRSTHRAFQREEQRRQKELRRQKKEIEKMEALERAAYEVDVYENHIDLILSIHKEYGDLIDWVAISQSKEPPKPSRHNTNESNFKAGFFTKLVGNAEKKKSEAIKKDDDNFTDAQNQWKLDLSEWKESKSLADNLLSGNEESKIDFIKKINPFSDVSELGSSLNFEIKENSIVEVILNPRGQDIVPTEKKSLLQSGKLSVKKMPKGIFNEIFQDYICSSILRVGNELLAILPDNMVLVHVMDDLLNTKTGHKEQQCIVSVAISRKTISGMNMDMIDPSDSLENFVHKMNFIKTKGFQSVEKLSPSEFSCEQNKNS
jgi:hypothetical protein